ncbi:hypothetical protein [Gemmata sp. SH-PL17]|uniref:hypothetical protein n=1 Tax=Gemmata sp. SH-PL17 TaxID=1630693 RepID=UPI0012FC1E9F|nr:hypothetical protein [Gemmata sp. SH-PL17]
MLRSVDATRALCQGDIIIDVPFFVIPKAITLVLHGEKERITGSPADLASFRNAKDKAKQSQKGLLAIEMPIEVECGIILTQDCDLDNKDAITVARLYPLATYAVAVKDALTLDEPLIIYDFKKRITEGADFANLIYTGQPIDETLMCADLLRTQVFPKAKWYDYLRGNRVKGLHEQGLRYLQGRLSAFTGRFATDTGFWHTEIDKICAAKLQADKSLLQKAHQDLASKKASKKPETPQ